jgi:hypothetical protein
MRWNWYSVATTIIFLPHPRKPNPGERKPVLQNIVVDSDRRCMVSADAITMILKHPMAAPV